MQVFLTGGTGFIGQPLTDALLRRGWTVRALVRNPDKGEAQVLRAKGAVLIRGDVTDRESMRAGMTSADIVVHNAGFYEFGVDAGARQRMYDINVKGTTNVLSLAHELGISHTVYVSSTVAFGATGKTAVDETFERQAPIESWYEQTKTDAHRIALDYQERGLPLVIVCPNGVIGPNDHSSYGYFARLYLNHLLAPAAWAPDSVVSMVEVHDLAEGIALAAEKGRAGETYLLAGEPLTRREMVEVWATRPGGAKVRFWLPTGLTAALFAPLEPLQRRLGLPAFISSESVRAGAVDLSYSSAKAQRELGWRHRSAREAWEGILDRELELLAKRTKRDLVSRLNPLPLES
jgi:dihydroflavonol-4-reductase